MPKIRVSPTNGGTVEIQCEPGGPLHTFMGGQIAEVNVPMEFARVANIPGCQIVDETIAKPQPPPVPRAPRRRR